MDSLLIVLIVIGVIMILAGIARLRSKRRHAWGDIDHSVLFSKSGHGREAAVDLDTAGIASVENRAADDAGLDQDELQQLNRFVVDEGLDDNKPSAESFEIKLDADDARAHERRPPAAVAPGRPRSILGKLRRGHDAGEAPVEDGAAQRTGHKEDAPDKVVVLNVMAPPGQHFVGSALIETIESCGLRYGDMQFFQYLQDDAPLFGLVNMVKPGVFDLENVDQLSTPGVSLFIQMPNAAVSGLAAFDTMLVTAQELAQKLGGELRDETRSVLTHSAIDHIRQQLAEYDCKWLASA